jgi:PAS domain S-box-containing protein
MARILIIDDERNIREALAAILKLEGYASDVAEDYDEAVGKLENDIFDLVITDIVLGGKTGIDVLNHINKRKLRCPVIVITGAPSIETASEAVRLGADNYITKPFSDDAIVNAARISLMNKRNEDEKEKYRKDLEAVFSSVTDGILTVDNEMNILAMNPAFAKMCDAKKDVMEKPISKESMDCSGKCVEVLKDTLIQGRPIEIARMECINSTGRYKVISANTSPLIYSGGEVSGAVLVVRDETRLFELESKLDERKQYHMLIGESAAMKDIYSILDSLSNVDSTVLILGESGTGKELAADALHFSGPRKDAPLIKVNCSALADNLLESELFGHVKGAFTGAVSDRIGRFQAAEGGTIILDEIGDISPALQVKLLRVIQEKEIERVGDSSSIKIDVRLIAATNRDLKDMVQQGKFREDLYYRLKVVEVELPPLRDKREDIPLLVERFLNEFNDKLDKAIRGVSQDVMDILLKHPWPGNVRELRHTLEHATIFCSSQIITISDLPQEYRDIRKMPEPAASEPSVSDDLESVRSALTKTGWNKTRAAKLLGISRQTLYTRIKEYGLNQE